MSNQKIQFYINIDTEEKSSNIELWKNDFYDLSQDCLILIYYIYSQFVSSEFVISKKKFTYKAIIPINRQFHL